MHDLNGVSDADKYEHTDWQLKLVLVTGVVLTGVTLLAFAAGYVIMQGFGARPAMTEFRPSPMADEDGKWTTEMRLQDAPWDAFDEFQEEQTHTHTSYGIVSEEPEIYRIPVEVAMEIVAEKGLVKIDAIGAPAGPPTESTEH